MILCAHPHCNKAREKKQKDEEDGPLCVCGREQVKMVMLARGEEKGQKNENGEAKGIGGRRRLRKKKERKKGFGGEVERRFGSFRSQSDCG